MGRQKTRRCAVGLKRRNRNDALSLLKEAMRCRFALTLKNELADRLASGK
jgi:hypothetical protein